MEQKRINLHRRLNFGFTLLEVLVAVSLSALVMLVLSMGMNVIIKDWMRSGNHLDESLDTVLTVLQIERAITGAFPHTYVDEKEKKEYVFFEGEEDKLTWVSTVSPGRQSRLTAWQLLPSEEEKGVELRVVPAFADNPMERLEEEETDSFLAFEGYKAEFEYLYIDDKFDSENEWQEEWEGKKRQSLPNAVRLRLTPIDNDGKQPMEIIAMILAHTHQTLQPIKP